MINKKPVTVSIALGEGVACNTIFSWPFMQTIMVSINTKNNAFVRGILGEQFRLEMMVPQTAKEAPKTSEGLLVSSPVSIQEKEDHIKDQVSRNSKVKLKKTVIHKC